LGDAAAEGQWGTGHRERGRLPEVEKRGEGAVTDSGTTWQPKRARGGCQEQLEAAKMKVGGAETSGHAIGAREAEGNRGETCKPPRMRRGARETSGGAGRGWRHRGRRRGVLRVWCGSCLRPGSGNSEETRGGGEICRDVAFGGQTSKTTIGGGWKWS